MKGLSIFIMMVLFLSCSGRTEVEKPAKVIDEKTMENIIYDLSLLQAIKNVNPQSLTDKKIEPTNYIYKKYKIDSLQFAQNNKYYAVQVELYQKMYQKVNERLLEQKAKLDSLNKKSPEPPK
ncbi:DUF4296 domain-containing protein [Flavobacterium sp. '19STA2R22 D10 B1']|uniref:DUF4296 domain-containing protein n=1 Tax=Flavobacterium aerium TaxID=3037261 RepID=UPI00278BFE66|nr:DUF4296 domain-containing protein [Flavobacterium sp. '19STA2R22 D10 B1']